MKKRCICSGSWRARSTQWLVSLRKQAKQDGKLVASSSSLLYCRICRRHWRSSGRYVATLLDVRKEPKRKSMSDRMLLRLLQFGRLRVDFETGQVFKQRFRWGRWQAEWFEIRPRTDRNREGRGPPYYFVAVSHNWRRKEIVVSRLVWLAHSRQLIPPDHDVDHVDGNKANNALRNLRLLPSAVNRSSVAIKEVEF